jgi:hypothetical protein
VTAGQDNLVLLWDAASGRQFRIFYGHQALDWGGIPSVALTPDGKRLLINQT